LEHLNMKITAFNRVALGSCAAVAFLTACSSLRPGQDDMQPPINAPGAMASGSSLAARADRTNYKVLHSFLGGNSDGGTPAASLIDVNGTLYGTTERGGTSGLGTVFAIAADGAETVLHSFGNGTDGAQPLAPLIEVKGRLYGTTVSGGTYGDGTVFRITPGGKEKVLYSFRGGTDAARPVAALIDVKGMLYGTTPVGGVYVSYDCYYGCGTVYSITPSGTETVLHSFGNGTDGAQPVASLIGVKGTLYGTTIYGGADGQGSVFTITPSGTEAVLHSFAGGSDGARPLASLINVTGTLYGTTAFGGMFSSGRCSYEGCSGTVFSLTPSGTEKVLHSFGDGTDGGGPVASLIVVKGKLYGTTAYGGKYRCCQGYNSARGTVFSITPSGSEKVLHSFGNGTDGSFPGASLTDLSGKLYGTTEYGGQYGSPCTDGCGTAFALNP
jgi:uncharacterized repeat protein (TIGR03803 family)